MLSFYALNSVYVPSVKQGSYIQSEWGLSFDLASILIANSSIKIILKLIATYNTDPYLNFFFRQINTFILISKCCKTS